MPITGRGDCKIPAAQKIGDFEASFQNRQTDSCRADEVTPQRVVEEARRELASKGGGYGQQECCNRLGSLYFHIPFCSRKCPYCHFYVVPDKNELKELLLRGLKLELATQRENLAHQTTVSVYFGGGTPALFGPGPIGEIVNSLDLPSDCEITLEANPEEITLQLIRDYAACGINRVSIGVQSLHDPTLQMLGRRHSAKKAQEAIALTKEAGIDNISIDLMFEIPKQTEESWEETLLQLYPLPITHLSLYNLTFEAHTAYEKRKRELLPLLPSPESNLAMLEMALFHLEKIGLKRYEISAFAKQGYESRHNTGYWTGRPFLGFGPSACSFWEGKRFRNLSHLRKYVAALEADESPIEFSEQLSPLASLHERLAVALRRLEGVDKRAFPVDPAIYSLLEAEGWLITEGNQVRLTPKGLLFHDMVAEEIIIPHV